MQLILEQSQRPSLGQQMQQSMEILRMDAAELDAYLKKQALENPLIEYEPRMTAFRGGLYTAPAGSGSDGDAYQSLLNRRHRETTLAEHLSEQLSGMRLPLGQRRLVSAMIECLDERGYLPARPQEWAENLNASDDQAKAALKTLQSMEPAGVGARSLAECLYLQLRRKERRDPVAELIAARYLREMAKGQYGELCRRCGVGEEEILRAKQLILTLNPKPGNGFASAEDIPYAPADLVLTTDEDDEPRIGLNAEIQPRFRIRRDYALPYSPDGLGETEADAYLRDRLRVARWLEQGLRRRQSTLLACGEAIAKRQRAYLIGEAPSVVPFTMRELAEALSLNPSTITRALKGKTLRTPTGTFPLASFFARPIRASVNGPISAAGVKERIARLVADEPADAPLSDQAIAALLAGERMDVSRRTVAKYREELFIPSSFERRESGRKGA